LPWFSKALRPQSDRNSSVPFYKQSVWSRAAKGVPGVEEEQEEEREAEREVEEERPPRRR